MNKLVQIITTCVSKSEAENIGQLLLEMKLTPCVQNIGPITSRYWWEGKIETSEEYLLLIKSKKENFEKIREIIKQKHSYELPEIIGVDISEGDEDYISWFDSFD